MSKQSYPLCWPADWKRTPKDRRVSGKFKSDGKWIAVGAAVRRLVKQLEMMGANIATTIVSTNVQPRLDGMPSAGERQPEDPGAAVYWDDGGQQRCMATDRYTTVADNLAALAATLEAMRAIERHGGAEILTRAFLGFAALPERNAQDWRKVLGFDESQDVTRDQAKSAFRELAKIYHTDNPQTGNRDMFDAAKLAYENALIDIPQ